MSPCSLSLSHTYTHTQTHKRWDKHIDNIQQSSKVQPRWCCGSRFQYLRWEPGLALKWKPSLWGPARCEMQSQHKARKCNEGGEGGAVWTEMNGRWGRGKVRPLVIICTRCRADPSSVCVTSSTHLYYRACEGLVLSQGETASVSLHLVNYLLVTLFLLFYCQYLTITALYK